MLLLLIIPVAPKLGFAVKTLTVLEGEEYDLFPVSIALSVEGTSEREHEILFRVETDSTATVESVIYVGVDFDATFGTRYDPEGPLEEVHLLYPGETEIQPLRVTIKNDFLIEEQECFTLRAFIQEGPDGADFTCNNGPDATDFFCEITICIEDNDGMLFDVIQS